MSEHSSLIRSVVMAGAATLLGIHSPAADAALFAYDPFTVGAGPSVYLAGDEDAGTNVLGGQNPAIGPTAFYGGAWDRRAAMPRRSKMSAAWPTRCFRKPVDKSGKRFNSTVARLGGPAAPSLVPWAAGALREPSIRAS